MSEARISYVFTVNKGIFGGHILMVRVINNVLNMEDYFGPAASRHLPEFFRQLREGTKP